MKKKYSYQESHKVKNHGKIYDKQIYTGNTYDNLVWQLEQSLLKNILPKNKKATILDFACGTGRITSFLEEQGFETITGIDVSDTMLREAKLKLKVTKLLNVDINSMHKNKKIGKFDTILAFRFFLNADPDLRQDTLKNLKPLLNDDGSLIFNIHGNKFSIRSLSYFLKYLKRKIMVYFLNQNENPYRYNSSLSVTEINSLLKQQGFKTKKIISYSFLPAVTIKVISPKLWFSLESKLVSHSFWFGTHLIYVCEKN